MGSITAKPEQRRPIVLAPGGGRQYPMGRIAAVFKARAPHHRTGCALA